MGGNGKTPSGSPRSSCHAESSPERKFLRNVGAASSREPAPAHRTFACLTPPPPHRASAWALVCVTLQLPLWERGPPRSLSPSSGWGGSSGLPEDPGLITSPLSLHQLSGKSCGSLSCYLKLGWTEEGRAEVLGACGRSEAVPSSKTVPAEQPHSTLVHWERTHPRVACTQNLTWPTPDQNNPHFTVRTLNAQFQSQALPGLPQEPHPQD